MRAWLVVLCGLVHSSGAAMLLTSPAFVNFGDIPTEFACDPYHPTYLDGISPPLEWFRAPAKTQSFVLLVDNIDSETGAVHWLVSNIPANTTQLDKGVSRFSLPDGAREFVSTTGSFGYSSFCSIDRSSTYRFRLYALRVPTVSLSVPSNGDASFPLNVRMIEEQLSDLGDDVIYVANLVGKLFVSPADPNVIPIPEAHPPIVNMPAGAPIPLTRYVKPSERFKNQRHHYSPRPMLNGTEIEAICKRSKAINSTFTQLCGAQSSLTSSRIAEILEGGGQELPQLDQSHDVKKHLPAVPLHALQLERKHNQGPPARNVSVDLEDWSCNQTVESSPLLLRSPVIDPCVQEGLAVVPKEFACDPADPSQSRAVPPLEWRLQPGANASCTVGSYVLLLEDLSTHRLNYILIDIPSDATKLGAGFGLDEGELIPGREILNSYRMSAMYPPCSDVRNAHAYRFHIVARKSLVTHFLGSDSSTCIDLIAQMNDTCYQAKLDFAAAASTHDVTSGRETTPIRPHATLLH